MSEPASLDSVFRTHGWEAAPPRISEALSLIDAVFLSSYAVVSVVLCDEASHIVDRWVNCQLELSDLLERKLLPEDADQFLVFIAPTIPQTVRSDLEETVSNTHVARKICLEQGSRTIEDTLLQTPFLVPRANAGSTDDPALLTVTKLPPDLLEDLSSRSAETILKRLVDGTYSSDGEAEELS